MKPSPSPAIASSEAEPHYPGFARHALPDGHAFWTGRLPDALCPDDDTFERWWQLHPGDFHEIMMHGRLVRTPRWQQAYGADYRYTGRVNRALPVPAAFRPLHAWAHSAIDPRLNGLLLNWYDGGRKHYIGPHRDSTHAMVAGVPIVTLSFGEARVFRLRSWRGEGAVDFAAEPGSAFVLPYATNLAWTHEVPHFARHTGRRISITLRAFEDGAEKP